MFVLQEDNGIGVYNKKGKLVHKSINVLQYRKLSDETLVIITDNSIDFVTQVTLNGKQNIVVTVDTNFVSALIIEDHVLVLRKIVFNLIDIYDHNLINVLRLYQNLKGEWVFYATKFKLPMNGVLPLYLKAPILYCKRKGKLYVYDLSKQTLKPSPNVLGKGLRLVDILPKFVGGV